VDGALSADKGSSDGTLSPFIGLRVKCLHIESKPARWHAQPVLSRGQIAEESSYAAEDHAPEQVSEFMDALAFLPDVASTDEEPSPRSPD